MYVCLFKIMKKILQFKWQNGFFDPDFGLRVQIYEQFLNYANRFFLSLHR